jgi:magnesium transporter
MARFIKGHSKKADLPPGTPFYIGEEAPESFLLSIYEFSKSGFQELSNLPIAELTQKNSKESFYWIDVRGLADAKAIERVGTELGLHRLWLEDVMNTDHRPKIEDMNDTLFAITKIPSYWVDEPRRVWFEQISLFLKDNIVITFQEFQEDCFSSLKKRLSVDPSKALSKGVDFLYYLIFDKVVDENFHILEKLGTEIEAIESQLIQDKGLAQPATLARIKTDLLFLRKAAIPLRKSISMIFTDEITLLSKGNTLYFKDLKDHAAHITAVIEDYREILKSIDNTIDSLLNQKLNEIMKTLTVFAAIFIPLTFVAGIYGMNFENIPELKWAHGYLYVWSLLITIAIAMLVFFKRRRWF